MTKSPWEEAAIRLEVILLWGWVCLNKGYMKGTDSFLKQKQLPESVIFMLL